MSESLYDVNLILELTISVNAKTIEEAEGKIAELSDAELLSFVQEQLPYMDDKGCLTSAH